MPKRLINFNLDIAKKDNYNKFEVKQFDSVTLDVKLLENGLALDTTGSTAILYVGYSNELYNQDYDITINENNVYIELDKNILKKKSVAYAEIELTDSQGTVTSSTFTFKIVDKLGEGATVPGIVEGFVEKYQRSIAEFKVSGNKAVLDLQEDYEGLKRIIINENQAADLQNQLNQTNSQLETKASNETVAGMQSVLSKKAEVNDTQESIASTFSSSKIKSMINTIPKGDKGDPGTASVSIDDTKTNTSQTWTSSKLNKNIIKGCYLRGISITTSKNGSNLTLNLNKFGSISKIYLLDCNGTYNSFELLDVYELNANQAVVYNTVSNLIEIYTITELNLKDKFIIWLNVDGYLAIDHTKKLKSDEVCKYVFYRDSLSVSYNSTTITLNFTGSKRLYYYLEDLTYKTIVLSDSYNLAHNDCLVLNIFTNSVSIKSILTQGILGKFDIVLALNIDGKIHYGELCDLINSINNNSNKILTTSQGEFKFKFTVDMTGSYMSSHILVGNELWVFPVSNDAHTDYFKVKRYEIDFNNLASKLVGEFEHNFGHMNSSSYNKITDSIICATGITSYSSTGEILIFENASSFKTASRVEYSSSIKIDVSSFGNKLNVVWGENNNGYANICYAITNDNKNIRKLLLGQGSNNLGNGVFLSGKTGLQYNGTYKILNEYYQTNGDDVNQGTAYVGGNLYIGLGHSSLWYSINNLNDDGTISKKFVKEQFYNEIGEKVSKNTQGITITDNYILIGQHEGSLNEVFVYGV